MTIHILRLGKICLLTGKLQGSLIMVESIGSGRKIIITKPKAKAKEKTEQKDNSFDKTLKDKTGSADKTGKKLSANSPQARLKVVQQQQQIARMQKLQNITRQVQDGTYKMIEPEILADKLYSVITDKKSREKFIKKFLKEESEKLSSSKGKISKLELKKLVFMIKETQQEEFDDPELEKLLKQFS